MKTTKNINLEYIPGSKWVYYKLYCGTTSADMILIDTIKPLTERLLKENHITSWFFIRYNDPNFHLRVRFCLKDNKYIGALLSTFKEVLQPYINHNQLWDVQLNTYKPELERYGYNTMSLSEMFFFYDSTHLLNNLPSFIDDNDRCLFALKHISTILKSFNFSINDSYKFVKRNRNAFKSEHRVNKMQIRKIDLKYRSLKTKIETILEDKNNDTFAGSIKNMSGCIINYKNQDQLEVDFEELIESYIHMSVNRIFKSEQRFCEFLCYEFLYKILKTKKYYTKR